ncbi:MAG: hypothetical protein C0600_05610 [Ignavibacteria bacterium]|nr:MAG: hypothetical protein C0600_05610 [Ignavibacteria bacterium]
MCDLPAIPYISLIYLTPNGSTMQTFELLTMIAFLIMYLGSALRAITMPDQYRDAEVEFYKTGKPGLFELVGFVFTSLAFALLIVHFVTEPARLGQVVLYAMVILFEIIMPFHFMSFYRSRMVSSLKNKTPADYKSSGLKRMAIGVVIILLPLIYP